MKKLGISMLSSLFLCSCTAIKTADTMDENIEAKEVIPSMSNKAINLDNFDKQVRPQDDFFSFVNGNWIKNANIPSDKARWGSFDELREAVDSATLGILKGSLTQSYASNSEGKKIADLYQTITDTISRNAEGMKPLTPYLSKIRAIKSLSELQDFIFEENQYGLDTFFSMYVYNHMKNSNKNVLYLDGPSLGMGRDYYQKDDADSKEKLQGYEEFLTQLFTLSNDKSPAQSAKQVVAFEKSMAQSLLTNEQSRDSKLQYNPYAIKDLSKIVANISLKSELNKAGVTQDSVIISELNYYKKVDQFITLKNLPIIKKYLEATLINNNLGMLSTDLEKINFDFYSKKLRGIQSMRPLDKRALQYVNNSLGEVLGKVYVEKYFPAEAKAKAKEMIGYLNKSYAQHISNLTWMSEDTKTKAQDKLNKITVKIGYPDKWKDYTEMQIKNKVEGGSYFLNNRMIQKFYFDENMQKLNKPVDRTEWGMNPQTVNAYYNPTNNEIVFPAAILQAPFYDYTADAAVNFGGIGAVIGHEISHGFDDSGSDYDGNGNLINWWAPSDASNFKEAGKTLADQYSKYEPLKGIFVNGQFTLGENIGDLGGVNTAYTALEMYLADHPKEKMVIDNFTPEQRFFLSWGTIWRVKAKDEFIKNQVKTDPHSPGYYRVNGPLENMNAFYDAFEVKPSDKMYKTPENRIVIW